MQFDNLLGNRQAEPGAHPGGFGGEERIKNPGQVLVWNPGAGVIDFRDHRQIPDPKSRRPARALEMAGLGQLFGVRPHRQRPAFGHGVDGVKENIDEDLLDLRFVHADQREPFSPQFVEMNPFLAQLMAHQLQGPFDQIVEIMRLDR